MRKFSLFFATGFGAGYSPWMPGTMGSAVGVALFWVIRNLAPVPYTVTVVTFTIFGCWVSGLADQFLGTKDNSKIVIDEIAGIFVTMAFVPVTWKSLLAGFVLFRLFDIWKPFPARLIQDKVPGGWGVVGDDVMVAVYANLVLQAARHFGVL